MADTLASFRDLAGLGPACEARLHAAGVHSWRALDEVLDAVGHLGNDGESLLGLRDELAARTAEGPAGSDGERAEAFIVRLAVDSRGRALRSAVTHVRSRAEQPNVGWHPDQLTGFIEDCCRLARIGEVADGSDAS